MNVIRTFNNWRNYQKTVAELGRLSQRELRDIGIEGDVRTAARKAFGF